MRLSSFLIIFFTFITAAGLSLITASYSVTLIEENSEIGVRNALDDDDMTWAEVQADGLQVTLAGVAPTEAVRFRALTTAGGIVDAARVIDEMEVEVQAAIAAPRFSAEILRNDSGLSVIGLIPGTTDRDAVMDRFNDIAGDHGVADLLQTADYPAPDGWEGALAFALSKMEKLPRAKISIEANRVSITAITDSPAAKQKLEADLKKATYPGLTLILDISAPRPVITPFTLRFEATPEGAKFDACSADTDRARDKILAAAIKAGATGAQRCIVGLGVPSPRWAEAVAVSMSALTDIGGGSITFADADITLIALEGTDQRLFDKVVGELETALPDVFALDPKLPAIKDPDAGPPEFTATLSPEGQVQLRGRVSGAPLRELADSYAKARFGSDKVYTAARIVDDLPGDWATRVLAGIEALSGLSNGVLVVTPTKLSISGNTGNPDASSEISTLLLGKLGGGTELDVDVVYQKKLDPVLGLPTPDECEAEIGAILSTGKINFEPGSATIDASALGTMDDIAAVIKRCGELQLEIQGYTDSQGREEMNLALSQSRAESVLNELRARRVPTRSFTATGFGEETPIADNKTEAGREANRRIEFRLIRPDTVADPEQTTLESVTENSDTETATTEEDTPDEQN
ncbi:hypothetical protein C1J03_04080 [Sulfitobacter sp. SK012]|uniref:OmpA family protein n=1 Tax=Sulfitobacter sp. SK012 TaxID=1389005 RepID=UPI000E0C4E12|nr:OmpA family protein [Sulfitobacter sp. SK012]AXI45285.1 hypothetical protein C1J03_04080 [Sulfitobacter sp. SK012]